MDTVYRFLATYEGLIYILLILGGLFSYRWLWKSWREWRDSVFGLEREFAKQRLSQSGLISLLILFLFFGELFLASFVVPSLPAAGSLATPTLDMISQAEDAFTGSTITAQTAVAPALESALDLPDGCIPGEIIITSPKPGQEVSGTVTIIGTVDVDNFGFYKYEVSPVGAEAWTTISAGRDTVRSDELGLWDTASLAPGDYELSLEAIDNLGEEFPPCVISVRVIAP